MKKYRITFLPSERIFDADDGETILDAAMKAGVYINASCGGNGSCGKCRIKVIEGNVVSTRHPKISRTDHDNGYRLACNSRPQGDVIVEVPLESQIDRSILQRKDRKPLILTASGLDQLIEKWKPDPSFFKVNLKLPEPTVDDNLSDFGRLVRELRKILKKDTISAELNVLKKMAGILRESAWKTTVTVAARNDGYEIVNIEPENKTLQNYAIVIDIGTTTVSGQILDLVNCGHDLCTLAESSDYNSQIRYGDDVISRIMYSRKKNGLESLQKALVDTVNGIIHQLIRESGIKKSSISHLIFAGNTTMTHLFFGLDPKNIMLAPYTPVSNVYPLVSAKDLGLDLEDHVYIQASPCVSSYVGGDIVAGVIGSGMSRSDKVTLYVDIGTNGEIVLGNKDWLVCASCSAGPAFEGGGIQFGMRAEKGAIEQLRLNPKNYEPMIITIGKEKPKGICGSGLIDCVSELFLARVLDQNGKFRRDLAVSRVREGESGYEYVVAYRENTRINRDIVVTEVDLANLIRAKAALYAGCKVLLEDVGLTFHDVERIFIAGGFGHYIDIEKAQVIGLLPELPLERFIFIGNGSLLGARLFSFSKGFMEEAENISKMMTNIELSNSQRFMDEFVAACFLPHTDDKGFPKVLNKLN
ncbi:MAG: ASKHA domain-containing protein [Syntrophorhabdus sp.]